MKFKKVSPWFHLLILCFHHSLQRDMKWRQAWKELTGGGGSMWWYDHSLSALASCVCVCLCACVCVCVFVYICVHGLNRVWLWYPCSLSNTSHLPTAAKSQSKKDLSRPRKVGLHLNNFSKKKKNWLIRITFLHPVGLAEWYNTAPRC